MAVILYIAVAVFLVVPIRAIGHLLLAGSAPTPGSGDETDQQPPTDPGEARNLAAVLGTGTERTMRSAGARASLLRGRVRSIATGLVAIGTGWQMRS